MYIDYLDVLIQDTWKDIPSSNMFHQKLILPEECPPPKCHLSLQNSH